ncbi:hypothetical protein F4778DRAFT_800004 [Xylariomycetidae sp. FL2044]|nr:hypothetical protein F4778DRAFT_800004 [Xylariomycetidae sp. FL2044]
MTNARKLEAIHFTITTEHQQQQPRPPPQKSPMASLPTQIAETIQTAHIQRAPSPHHDLNPSTAASAKEPVRLDPHLYRRHQHHHYRPGEEHEDDGAAAAAQEYEDSIDEDDVDDEDDDIPISVLKPYPRRGGGGGGGRQRGRPHFPPMPDLRFEQSYLHSLRDADTAWKVVWVTVRDQMMMPLAQGVLYNLAVCGWQHWNRNARLSGNSAGARIRRWWYGVNNWPLPKHAR